MWNLVRGEEELRPPLRDGGDLRKEIGTDFVTYPIQTRGRVLPEPVRDLGPPHRAHAPINAFPSCRAMVRLQARFLTSGLKQFGVHLIGFFDHALEAEFGGDK